MLAGGIQLKVQDFVYFCLFLRLLVEIRSSWKSFGSCWIKIARDHQLKLNDHWLVLSSYNILVW
jgi:hypothetical protein